MCTVVSVRVLAALTSGLLQGVWLLSGNLAMTWTLTVMSAGMGASHTLLESEETKLEELVRVARSRVRVGYTRWAPGPSTGYSVGSQPALCLPCWSPEDMYMWKIEDE